MDDYFSHKSGPGGGTALTKQMSISYVTPRNIDHYREFFRQSSNFEEGWIEMKLLSSEAPMHNNFQSRWMIFDNSDNGKLKIAESPESINDTSTTLVVPMDSVVSFKTDGANGSLSIFLTTTQYKLCLRAASRDEIQRWLFVFQKSVALVLSCLIGSAGGSSGVNPSSRPRHPSTSDATGSSSGLITPVVLMRQPSVSTRPLEPPPIPDISQLHPSQLLKRRNSMNNSGDSNSNSNCSDQALSSSSAAIGGASANNKNPFYRVASIAHFDRLAAADGGGGIVTAIGGNKLSQSIHSSSSSDKLAGSYVEPTSSSSMLESAMKNLAMDGQFEGGFANDSSHSRGSNSSNGRGNNRRGFGDSANYNSQHSFGGDDGEDSHDEDSNNNSNSNSNSNSGSDRDSPGGAEDDELLFDLDDAPSAFSKKKEQKPTKPRRTTDGHSSGNDRNARSPAFAGPGNVFGSNSSSHSSSSGHSHNSSSYKPATGSFVGSFSALTAASTTNSAFSGVPVKTPASTSASSLLSTSFGINHHMAPRPVSPASSNSNHSIAGTSFSNKPSSLLTSSLLGSLNLGSSSLAPSPSHEGAALAYAILGWESGSCSKRGPRETNEDRLVDLRELKDGLAPGAHSTESHVPSKTHYATDPHGYFAVYDGHCGDHAASYLQQGLHESIVRHPQFYSSISSAIHDTCIKTDKDFLEMCQQKRWYSGTTALGVFVRRSELVAFSIGDCRVVLCNGGVAEPIVEPHKPGRPDESARIHRAQGWITEEKELYVGRLHMMDLSDPVVRDKASKMNWTTIHRVCGELAVSRSIGDRDYKGFVPGAKVDQYFCWPEGHDQVFMADLVIPNPECKVLPMQRTYEFFVLASDGLWDVVNDDEAVQMTRAALAMGKSPLEAADDLAELALKLGSSDNVTVIVVKFVHRS